MSNVCGVIKDSISPAGVRLTTVRLRYPRFIHAELMTHRVFSRNASSSRAIPVKRLIEDCYYDEARPVYWGRNRPGMQATDPLDGWRLWAAETVWSVSAALMRAAAGLMARLQVHKQIANRLMEPFTHINVLVTSTEWDNFFALRAHSDAQPEIQKLAVGIRDAMTKSTPSVLQLGEWHLPYVTKEELEEWGPNNSRRISAARCARVSYLTHMGKVPERSEDLQLFERLAGSSPQHLSPTEHQATPTKSLKFQDCNFRGWKQFRKEIEHG